MTVSVGDILIENSPLPTLTERSLFFVVDTNGYRQIFKTITEESGRTMAQIWSSYRAVSERQHWPETELMYWGADATAPDRDVGHFVPYPKTTLAEPRLASTADPVNQIPYLEGYTPASGPAVKGFYEHVCTFAHQLSLLQHTTLLYTDHNTVHVTPYHPHTDETNACWKWVWKYGRTLVSFCYGELETWSKLNPRGHAQNHLNWKRRRTTWIQPMMEWLCMQCDHPYWAETLLLKMPATESEWATALTPQEITDENDPLHGRYRSRIPRIDRTTWGPRADNTSGNFATLVGPSGTDAAFVIWGAKYKTALLRYHEKYASQAN